MLQHDERYPASPGIRKRTGRLLDASLEADRARRAHLQAKWTKRFQRAVWASHRVYRSSERFRRCTACSGVSAFIAGLLIQITPLRHLVRADVQIGLFLMFPLALLMVAAIRLCDALAREGLSRVRQWIVGAAGAEGIDLPPAPVSSRLDSRSRSR